MKLNKCLLSMLCVAPLLLTSCGNSGKSFGIPEAKLQMEGMRTELFDSPATKEYQITFKQKKDYFDSVKHTYHTQILTVDFNTLRIKMTDEKDDHNGSNLFQGEGVFWFWIDTEHNYDYHIAMVNDCDKNTHSITKGTLMKNRELLAIKSKMETPNGTYGDPRNYSLDLLDTLTDVFQSAIDDPDLVKNSKFEITSSEPGQLTFKNTGIFDKSKYPNNEYSELYEFKNNMIVKETYHIKTDDYLNDYSIEYGIDDYDIKLPNMNLFK